jgi:hypothetical protein
MMVTSKSGIWLVMENNSGATKPRELLALALIWYAGILEYSQDVFFQLTFFQSSDGKYIASGHESGSIYIFNNETGRIPFSLSGKRLLLVYQTQVKLTISQD